MSLRSKVFETFASASSAIPAWEAAAQCSGAAPPGARAGQPSGSMPRPSATRLVWLK